MNRIPDFPLIREEVVLDCRMMSYGCLLSSLNSIRAAMLLSLSCLIVALAVSHNHPAIRDFCIGAATGMLFAAFLALLGTNSITSKEDLKASSSDIQSLRLS